MKQNTSCATWERHCMKRLMTFASAWEPAQIRASRLQRRSERSRQDKGAHPKSKRRDRPPFGMHTGQPRTVGDMINEIGGDVPYFEDLSRSDKPRIDVHKQDKRVAHRLSALSR